MPETRIVLIGILAILLALASAGFGAYYYQTNNLSRENSYLSSTVENQNQQITNLGQQVTSLNQQVISMRENPSTTTFVFLSTTTTTSISTSVQTSTATSISTENIVSLTTYSQFSTLYSTVTTTSSIFPPSNSSYALTFVSGNATSTAGSSACSENIYVDVTYEMHQSLPSSGVIVWVKYPDGEVASTSPTSFPDQADITLDAGFFYQFQACGASWNSVNTWITDTSNNMLSPSTYLVIT